MASEGHICDNRNNLDLNELKDYILNSIKGKINEYYDLTKVSKEYYLQNVYSNIDNGIKQLEKQKQDIELEIENKKGILSQLYNDRATGILSTDEFIIIKNANTLEIEKLNTELKKYESDIMNLNINKAKQESKEKIFEKYKDIKELNRVILDAFISRIEIGKVEDNLKRNINIEWNLYTIG